MKRAALAIALAVALGGCGRQPARSPGPPPAEPRLALARQPAWLPSYGPEQRALLDAKPKSPVTVRARPVYPLLDHFSYVEPQPFSEVRARLAARIVEEQVERSSLLYVLGKIEARLANLTAQYGPLAPPEPDPWVVAVKRQGYYRLQWAAPGPEARRAVQDSNRALSAGDLSGAKQALQRATQLSPKVPGLWTALAPVLASLGDDSGAEGALREALTIDPRFADGYVGLAELYARRGAIEEARAAVARALALYPVSKRAWGLAERVARVSERPAPPAVFIEVASSGAILVGSPGGHAQRMYAMCRAGVRYEPEVRARLLRVSSEAPYRLSAGEELLCLEAMLGAYLSRKAEPDPQLEALLKLAKQGALTDYVMFDLFGQRRPEWLRLAPDEQHESVVRYVEEVVLGARR